MTKKDTSQIKDLNWPYIQLSYQVLEKAAGLLLANPDKYKDVTGYITLANELGKVNLGNLYTAFGSIDIAREVISHLTKKDASIIQELNWPKISLP